MAFQTGSQINPALGRIDYTPYLQGSIAGSQALGQGIANLGQGIASGIEQYQKQKKENKMMEAQLKANINSLEGLGAISSSLSPQAQEVLNGIMSKLNDPRTPLVEKLALSQSAQKTVGELINFAMQEKQKQEQTLSQQLAYDAAVSGRDIPLIYPQSVRAPAAIQSLAIQNQLATIAETQAKAAAVGVPKRAGGYATVEEAQGMANKMAKEAGSGFLGRTSYKDGLIFPEVIREQPETIVDPYIKLAEEEKFTQDKSIVAAAESATSTISAADRVIEQIDAGEASTGITAGIEQYKDKVLSAFGSEKAASRASSTELLEAAQGGLFLDQRAKEKITSTMLNTANELNFYRSIFAGTKEMEPQTIRKLALLRREISVASVESYNRALGSGRLDKYFGVMGAKPQAMEIPKQRTVVSGL